MKKPLVLGLVGPTASGKSSLALALAKRLGGQIVCMDALQVYRGLDIGTAKPSKEEQARVPHHLLDVVEAGEAFSVANYVEKAMPAIKGIHQTGQLPILCGGTGLYLRALSGLMQLGGTPKDPGLRAHYEALAQQEGRPALHSILQQKDPESAARLHPNDLRRVIRALEVFDRTGQPLSAQVQHGDAPYDFHLFALSWPREILYSRIDLRADAMLQAGLLEEVQGLLKAGVSPSAQSMQGLGYKELIPHLVGKASLLDSRELLQRRTRNYAKRQLTWFRADQRVRWLPQPMAEDAMLDIIIKQIEDT